MNILFIILLIYSSLIHFSSQNATELCRFEVQSTRDVTLAWHIPLIDLKKIHGPETCQFQSNDWHNYIIYSVSENNSIIIKKNDTTILKLNDADPDGNLTIIVRSVKNDSTTIKSDPSNTRCQFHCRNRCRMENLNQMPIPSNQMSTLSSQDKFGSNGLVTCILIFLTVLWKLA